MYRRAVITDEISQDLGVVLDLAQSFQLDGIEIRTIWDTRIDQLTPEQVRCLRSAVDDAGLVVCAVAPPFYKCDVDRPDERREHLDLLRRAIDVGLRLGTRLVRTFTFWREYALDEVWDRLVEAYQEPLDLARANGVTLAIENEAACHVGTGRELARFLAALDRPEAAALWDPCNALYAEPAERPFPDGYEAVRNRLVHVHLKDAVRVAGEVTPRLTPLGQGEVDVAGQLRALERHGYTGFVSLETHWRPQPVDEALLRQPGGRTFSESAAMATAYCLQLWDTLRSALPS